MAPPKITRKKVAAYSASTLDVDVKVAPYFLEKESTPEDSIYVWGYKVVIHNRRQHPITLRSRYWKITDGLGQIQEVQGQGVVGKQPVIEPDGHFDYTSGAPLGTPSGIMYGHFIMHESTGDVFSVNAPAFSLDSPYQKQTLN